MATLKINRINLALILIISMLSGSLATISQPGLGIIEYDNYYNFSAYENIPDASNLKVINASQVYVDWVNTFYYYNESNINKDLTLTELQEQGCVCRHIAQLYFELAKKDGFYAYVSPQIQVEPGMSHVVTIVSSSQGWCVLDMDKFFCRRFA